MRIVKPIQELDRILEQAMEEGFDLPITVEGWLNGRLCIQQTVYEDSKQDELLIENDQPWKSGDRILFKVISKDGRFIAQEIQLVSSKPS